jgi:hypothetical protein
MLMYLARATPAPPATLATPATPTLPAMSATSRNTYNTHNADDAYGTAPAGLRDTRVAKAATQCKPLRICILLVPSCHAQGCQTVRITITIPPRDDASSMCSYSRESEHREKQKANVKDVAKGV